MKIRIVFHGLEGGEMLTFRYNIFIRYLDISKLLEMNQVIPEILG